jgi:Uma2 family endonuclease
LAGLHARLRGKPCRAIGSELKIAAGASFRYPDALVVCTPAIASRTLVADPVIVFEILSASTAHIDRITKNLEYRATPSIQRYVMLEQSEIGAFVFTRAGDVWISSVHGPHSMLPLTEAGIEIPIDELYEGLGFEQARPSES